jgi:hypothetical protein
MSQYFFPTGSPEDDDAVGATVEASVVLEMTVEIELAWDDDIVTEATEAPSAIVSIAFATVHGIPTVVRANDSDSTAVATWRANRLLMKASSFGGPL